MFTDGVIPPIDPQRGPKILKIIFSAFEYICSFILPFI